MNPRMASMCPDGYLSWRDGLRQPAGAELCLRYALAFNTLNCAWLAPRLAPDVIYESQSVFDKLEGAAAVHDYLSAKILTLARASARPVRCELAVLPQGSPCVVLFQAAGEYDANWLDEPLVAVTLTANTQGDASEIFMITGVPHPASARRSGIYPGSEETPAETPERVVRGDVTYQGLEFRVFLLNGQSRLDREMEAAMVQVRSLFPGAAVTWINVDTASNFEYWQLQQAGFLGFPAVAAYWRDQLVHRHPGLIGADAYVQAIRNATARSPTQD